MDMINGIFEFVGFLISTLNIKRLYKDKRVDGYDPRVMMFFSAWGFWNLFYYPSLGQWWSFFGGLGLVLSNTVWLVMVYYYKRKDRG